METLQALERGMRVLIYLNRVRFATTSEVSLALGLKRATAHRILRVLCATDMVRRDPASGLYTNARGVLDLCSRARTSEGIPREVETVMRGWTRKHGWPLEIADSTERGDVGTLSVEVRIGERDSAQVVLRCLPESLSNSSERQRWVQRLDELAGEIDRVVPRAPRTPVYVRPNYVSAPKGEATWRE